MRTFRKATIKDVAHKAGVSTTTVSLFMSGHQSVCSPETAIRIRSAVADLKYTPSSLTRGLRQKSVTTIGVCLSNPMDPDVMFGARFFEQLWRGVIFESDVHNYSLLHYPASIRETDRHDSLLDGRADGILLHDHLNARTVYLLSAGMPTVVLTRSVNLPEGCGAAYADDILSATIALDYLWDLGHRRIAHIAGPVGDLAVGVTRPLVVHPLWEDDVAIQRLNGYVGYMQAHGAYDPALIVYSQSWTSNRAIETVQAWLGMENPPTAVFCANDQQALGIIEAAHVLGVKIPDGLSVVGVDDTQNAKDMNPRLTSVAVPMEEIGRAGVVALLNLMEGKPMEQCRLQVPVSHISIRESAIAVGGHSRLSDRTRY